MCCEEKGGNIFFQKKLFQRKKPKGQLKFFRPTNLKQDRFLKFDVKKDNPGGHKSLIPASILA